MDFFAINTAVGAMMLLTLLTTVMTVTGIAVIVSIHRNRNKP